MLKRLSEHQEYRVNLIEKKNSGDDEDGLLMIDTEGQVVGQVNGLSVYDLGDFLLENHHELPLKLPWGVPVSSTSNGRQI